MDILKNIDTNVSSMISSSFDEYISKIVKEAVEKEKEKFLNDLNMCEEEYPVFDETKHKKFEACKLINDNSLLYQNYLNKISINTDGEYIFPDIKLPSNTGVEDLLGDKTKYYLTNKGNIYVSNIRPLGNDYNDQTFPGYVLFNHGILQYLTFSNCRGSALCKDENGIEIKLDRENFIKNKVQEHRNIRRIPNHLKSFPGIEDLKEKTSKEFTKNYIENGQGLGCRFSCNDHLNSDKRRKSHLFVYDKKQVHIRCFNIRRMDMCYYKDHNGWMEDCIERFLTNNICPDCRSGEIIPEKLDPDINIEIFRNPPIFNVEYIELLELLSKKDITIPIYQIQTIYAKYHPRANENFVIEEKLKKLTQIEKVVEERVVDERKQLQDEKEIYSEKIKQINEEKLKSIFSMFILRNERKENIKDKNTIREMIKRSNDKCKKKEQEQEILLEKQRHDLNSEKEDFEKEKEKFQEDKEEYNDDLKSKAKKLLDIANDINEINELQDDTLCKSEELFTLMKQLNELII